MPQTNQYVLTDADFPYHRDGQFVYPSDQFNAPENYAGNPSGEDQYFLPIVAGRTYGIRYTDPYESFYRTSPYGKGPPNTIVYIAQLVVWHNTATYYDYGPLRYNVSTGDYSHYWSQLLNYPDSSGHVGQVQTITNIDENQYPTLYFTCGAYDWNGDNELYDGDTRVTVAKSNAGQFLDKPLYSVDIWIVGAQSGARYRPIF